MRHIVPITAIVGVVAAIAFLRDVDAFTSMSPALLRLVILTTVLPPVIAAITWSPRGVVLTAVGVLLVTFVAVPFSQWGSELGPLVVLVLVADVAAVVVAGFRMWALRRLDERAGLVEIQQAIAERRDLAAFAEVVTWSGQRVMGSGTLRLWVLDRTREELRLVRGEYTRIRHGPDSETLQAAPDSIPLDATDPRAQSARLAQPAEGVTWQSSGGTREHPWIHGSDVATPSMRASVWDGR
jgi:hypothetical protein